MATSQTLPLFELRKLFYLYHPSEVCAIGELSEVSILSPGLLVTLPFIVEVLVSRDVLRNAARTYNINECLASFCVLLVTTLERSYFRLAEFAPYAWLHARIGVINVDACSTSVFIVSVLTIDFCRYWAHRLHHEVAVLWSLHEIHHSSDYYNLFIGVRTWYTLEAISMLFMLPMALFLPVEQFAVHFVTISLFGEWVHFSSVPRLGIFELVFVTPSAHRVHHARNRYAIDRNYGTIFIVWDRLFGTYEAEREDDKEEPLVFGTISGVMTYDPLRMLANNVAKMKAKVLQMPSAGEKLKALFYGPGWAPGKGRLGDIDDVPAVDCATPSCRLLVAHSRFEQVTLFVCFLVAFLACDKAAHVVRWDSEIECALAHLLCFFIVFALSEKLDGAKNTWLADVGAIVAYLILVWAVKLDSWIAVASALATTVWHLRHTLKGF